MRPKNSKFDIAVGSDVIDSARRGDLAAHEAIFRSFSGPVFNLALRICNHRESAEDVLQNTFIKVLGGIRSYQADAPFGIWLRQVAVNETLMHVRGMKRLPDFIDIGALESLDNSTDGARSEIAGEDSIHHDQVDLMLTRTLAQLPARTRAALWLKEIEGYSHKEIATMMGKSESYSKSLVARAIKRLRACRTVQRHEKLRRENA